MLPSAARGPYQAMAPVSSANSNSDGQHPRRSVTRTRISKPKVKTGCHNCKIKCDEKRPSCTQCERSKKQCSGYPAPPRSAWPTTGPLLAPKPAQTLAVQPPSAPPPNSLDPPDRRAMEELERQEQQQLQEQEQEQQLLLLLLQQLQPTPPQSPGLIAELRRGIKSINSANLYRPSGNLPLTQNDGLYFQLFRSHTANELSGYFDSVFWTQTVLQECHSDNAIRHAVVALGALYKTLEQSSESPPGSPSNSHDPMNNAMRHWEVAIRQYSEAINALFQMNQESKSHRTLLMASVLLACFDSFIGDHKQAIRQIQTGLGLLEELRAQQRKSFSMSSEEPVEQELVTMFTRLAVQAKSYDMAFHFPQPYVIRLTPQASEQAQSPPSDAGSSPASLSPPIMPDRFPSLKEARHAWDNLLEKMLRFTETMFNYTRASGTNNPMGILPKSWQQHGLSFRGQLDQWIRAFEPILQSRTAPGKSHQEKAGIAVLKMFQIMSQILYLMTFSDSELQFDAFQPQFKTIVDLALEVVGDEERRAAAKRCPDSEACQHRQRFAKDIFGGDEYSTHHIKPSFCADLGIVPPLFVVATKCRNPILRRQAIQLLRSSARREGMWDSELTAHIGHWVMTIEEDADRPSAPSPWSPATTSFARHESVDFGDGPLGPGGNARWDAASNRDGSRRSSSPSAGGVRDSIPEDKRVMVRAVDFDLRTRLAKLQVGTRGIIPGSPDMRSRVTQIHW